MAQTEWNTTSNTATNNGVYDDTVVDTPREKNASMGLLWLIALIAVVAAGLAWYKQSSINTAPLASTSTPIVIPAEETVAAKQEAARSEQRRAEAARRTTATTTVTPRSTAPRPLASNPTPRYPNEALRAGVGGTVMVRAVVDANGVPTDVAVVERSGHRELDRAAQAAVRKWRFEPAMRNGKAVSSTVQVPVDFKPI